METKKKTANEIQQELEYFTGTFGYHKHAIGNVELLLTNGCDYIRREAGAFWLFDAILSYQTHEEVKGLYHQVWRLVRLPDESWKLICEDGNNNPVVQQDIEYSDFPLPGFRIWVIDGVALLPTEY